MRRLIDCALIEALRDCAAAHVVGDEATCRRLHVGAEASGDGVEFSEDDLKQYFTTLKLESQGITKIDRFFPGFSNVEELSLSGNAISTIENLPARSELERLREQREA